MFTERIHADGHTGICQDLGCVYEYYGYYCHSVIINTNAPLCKSRIVLDNLIPAEWNSTTAHIGKYILPCDSIQSPTPRDVARLPRSCS